MRRSLRVRGWLDGIDAGIASQASRLAAAGRSADAATVLGGGGRRSRRDAEAAAARGTVCARLPAFGAALAEAGCRRATSMPSSLLLAVSATTLRSGSPNTPRRWSSGGGTEPRAVRTRVQRISARNLSGEWRASRQERLRRERNVRRWVDRHSGMCKTLLSLGPVRRRYGVDGDQRRRRHRRNTNQHEDDRTWDQLQADVVVDLLAGARRSATNGSRRCRCSSTRARRMKDSTTIRSARPQRDTSCPSTRCNVSCATPSSCRSSLVTTARRYTSAANSASPPVRNGGRCGRCTAPASTPTATWRPTGAASITSSIWDAGGLTDLDNLVPLCETHHHLVHEGDWTLQLFLIVARSGLPDGSVYHDGVTLDRTGARRRRCPRRRPPWRRLPAISSSPSPPSPAERPVIEATQSGASPTTRHASRARCETGRHAPQPLRRRAADDHPLRAQAPRLRPSRRSRSHRGVSRARPPGADRRQPAGVALARRRRRGQAPGDRRDLQGQLRHLSHAAEARVRRRGHAVGSASNVSPTRRSTSPTTCTAPRYWSSRACGAASRTRRRQWLRVRGVRCCRRCGA